MKDSGESDKAEYNKQLQNRSMKLEEMDRQHSQGMERAALDGLIKLKQGEKEEWQTINRFREAIRKVSSSK